MSTTYKDEFIIDVSKVGLIKETEDYITTRFDVRLIFGEIVVEDGKQWLEIQGDEDKRSLAKVYICNLCNPVETAEIEYPVELQEMLTDRELCYHVEHQTGVSLHFVRSGLISMGGSDPVSVTMAYSMLEDIISHNWDKTQEGASSRPKQASKRLDAELRRLSSQNKLDIECDISLQNDVIKRTILDVLWKTDQSSSSQASFEEFGITPHQSQGSTGTDSSNNMCLEKPNTSRYLYGAAEQLKKIDLKETAKISSDGSGTDEPGKYLKKFALDRGHSEEKIEDIFAVYGRNVKFDVFFRALNGLIEVPKDKRASPMKSTNASTTAVTDCCVTKDKDLSPADSAVATYMSRLSKDHEEEDSILNVEELKKRNAERQQLLLDALSKRSNNHSDCVINTSAAIVASEQTVTIDLTMDNSSDETDSCHRHTAHPQHNRVTRSRSPLNKAVLNGHGPPQQSALLSNGGAAASTVNPSLLRHIVIDGSNVAMTHGNGKVFSCRGIDIVVKYFVKRGHKDVTVFVPQWRTRTQSLDYKISDQHLLDTLKQQGYLVFTPSRRIQGKNIVCYDDRYVIRLAQEVDGVIVSNDNYRDLWRECPDWREVIENRLLMYSFVGDLFMPPDDPLGRHGPSLTEFLQKSVAHTKTRQHRPMNSQAFHGKSAPQGVQPHQMHQVPTQLIPAYIQPMLNNHVQNVARPWSNVVPVNSLIGAPLVYHNPSTSFNSANGSKVSGPNTANVTISNNPGTQPTTHQTNEWKQIPQKRWKQHSSKGRDESVTRTLYQSLQEVFRNCDEAIRRVLEDNPAETDLNTLSEYMLNYMSDN